MSSISSVSSYSSLSYASKLFSKMDTDASGSISEDEFTSAQSVSDNKGKHKGHGQISTLDDGMMQAMMQSMPQQDLSSVQEVNTDEMISAMDSDGNGTVTKEEFLAARPDDVTEEMATNLWNQMDTEGTGSLSTGDLQTAMAENRPAGGPPPMGPPPSEEDEEDEDDLLASSSSTDPLQDILAQLLESTSSDSTSASNIDEMIASMDADGNGTVTKDEFVAARPDDVSASMAENLWSQFDTEGAGSLSTSDLKTAMAENAPPSGGPRMAGRQEDAFESLIDQLTASDSTTSTDTTQSTSATSNSAALQAFLEAVKSYDATAGYEATKNVLSSLMALA